MQFGLGSAQVFREEQVQTYLCFICACKHIAHEGVDKFGEPCEKGTIAMRRLGVQLQHLLTESHTTAWQQNLSAKYYQERFGEATAMAPDLQGGSLEWKRKVRTTEGLEELLLCCPEDVTKSSRCQHSEDWVCEFCWIPLCNTCWFALRNQRKISKALANDNFIGYVNKFVIEHKVTWLEATIASPVFSGLVTYYIEGKAKPTTQDWLWYGIRIYPFRRALPPRI
jgi:hypothetical protein